MAFVAINVLQVPPAMGQTLEQRFASRAGEVERMEGFQSFELLRPVEGQDAYLVYTRWDTEEAFRAWTESPAFQHGHSRTQSDGPAASGSSLWTFEVASEAQAS
jgi:heme oxygenase (mycobilin-producing)